LAAITGILDGKPKVRRRDAPGSTLWPLNQTDCLLIEILTKSRIKELLRRLEAIKIKVI
jgi:hypothetical protein